MFSLYGREMTQDFRERRIDEDEKNLLWEWMFSQSDLLSERKAFDAFFKNDPDKYRLDNAILNDIYKSGLLELIYLRELRYLIRVINDYPGNRSTMFSRMS
jgi:hypothetical protein